MQHTSTCNQHAFSAETSGLFFKNRKVLSQRFKTLFVVMCQFGARKACVGTVVPDGVTSQETLTNKEISSPTIMTTSVAVHLLGLRVRIPLCACMSFCCECCLLSGRDLCAGLIPHPEE